MRQKYSRANRVGERFVEVFLPLISYHMLFSAWNHLVDKVTVNDEEHAVTTHR